MTAAALRAADVASHGLGPRVLSPAAPRVAATLAPRASRVAPPPLAPLAGPVETACEEPNTNCLPFTTLSATLSDGTTVRSADDFTPLESTSITTLCFWGAYAPNFPTDDDVRVTYYADRGGLPGPIAGGPFHQGDDLALEGPVFTGAAIIGGGWIYEYRATHAPVAVEAGSCYWVEVVNDAANEARWFWSFSQTPSGNGSCLTDRTPGDPYEADDAIAFGDLAFCVDAPIESAPCPGPPAVPTPPNCLALSTANATQSNGVVARGADDFSLTAGGAITTVTFWGVYSGDLLTGDAVSIRYFTDQGGAPGPLRAGPFVQGADLSVLSREPTGETLDGTALPIYELVAEHPPVALAADECVWIEIRNDPVPPGTWYWSWSSDSKGNGFCFVDLTPGTPYTVFDAETGHDFALCTNADLDTSDCAADHADLPGCASDLGGPCCEPHGSIGCGDAACCNAVCLLDPFCCTVEWDETCVQEAILLVPGCGCPDLPPDTCCLPPDWCTIMPYTQCEAIGGIYLPDFDCIDSHCVSPCILDVNEDLSVGFAELIFLLSQWGPCPTGTCLGADIAGGLDGSGDGVVNFADLLALLGAWGPCVE